MKSKDSITTPLTSGAKKELYRCCAEVAFENDPQLKLDVYETVGKVFMRNTLEQLYEQLQTGSTTRRKSKRQPRMRRK